MMNTKLIDTHAHLYWPDYKDDLDEVVKRSLENGVTTIINVGVDVEKSKVALKQVQETKWPPGITTYSTIGIHPHEALRFASLTQGKLSDVDVSIHKDIEKLEEIYRNASEKVVAVGECGLDYYLDRNDIYPDIILPHDQIKALQRQLFQAQIDLAKKLNLPLIVHCRDDRSQDPENSEAWDEVLKMVGTHSAILHCYSGLSHTTNYILRTTNLLVSFAGTITYPKNDYLRAAAKMLPLEKIVLETDCPFLPPQSKRGQRNEPANVLEIAQLIADIKQLSFDEVANQTTINVKNILKLK